METNFLPGFYSIRRASLFIAFSIISLNLVSGQVASPKELSSPDGNLHFTAELSKKGDLIYSISYKDQPVILSSLLGLEGVQGGCSFQGWSKNQLLSDVSYSEKDSSWTPAYGERNLIRDSYKEMVLTLLNEDCRQRNMQVIVRAYNEGIAFRYFFPEIERGRDISIKGELTNYTVPPGAKAWFTPFPQVPYKLLPLENWPSESERPLVLELENELYLCLTEAAMVNFSRAKFALHPEKPNTIITSLYGPVDLTSPFSTPWRVVMVAEQPGKLLENNDIILNLNPPSEIANTLWIKPGKVMREVTLSSKGVKETVDFAVKHNIQYIHIDAGWYGHEYVVESDATTITVDPKRNPNSDFDMQETIQLANENGLGVFAYINQRELVGDDLEEKLKLYKEWGLSGIKFGFVHVGSHRWTTWLHDAVKKCAEYNLLVNIHDLYRPTGFSRTYPNLLTQEGIHGNEQMPDATQNTVQPFTRFIAGPADYTIAYYHRPEFKPSLRSGQFSQVGIKTTSGHQLALPVLYYSPLQWMYWYDRPSDSQDEPELEFFDRVPTVWDDTKVLDGKIGEYVTIARRSGEEWFIGTITNTEPRKLKISLNFLDPGKKYEAKIFYDDPKASIRTKVGIKTMSVDASMKLDAKLLGSGGQAVWIRPL